MKIVQREKHYVDGAGNYIGMFVGQEMVTDDGMTVIDSKVPKPSDPQAVEVPTARPDVGHTWNGSTWQAPS